MLHATCYMLHNLCYNKIMNKIYKFIISLLICLGAGGIGSLFNISAIPTWYATINKASFNPPNWAFAPAWTILFILMAIALYLVWSSKAKNIKNAMIIFSIQLVLNILWSAIFFGLKSPALAFAEIIILWIAIFVNIIYFYRVNKTAGYLLIPYLIWVTFASSLNYYAWILN